MMLERLNRRNDMPVYSVLDPEFRTFGKVVSGYDFSPLIVFMEKKTAIPENGNEYVASVREMEAIEPLFSQIQNGIYGGMPVQIGYCNGRNNTYNGFEYHKGSEINVAVTDFCLVLGHTWQIENNTFTVGNETVFFVPAGTVIEMFETTLHLSPCRVTDNGFKDIVILPRGTNTPLQEKPVSLCAEDALLLQKNKWVIAHPEREPLIRQGAVPGLIGENKAIRY